MLLVGLQCNAHLQTRSCTANENQP